MDRHFQYVFMTYLYPYYSIYIIKIYLDKIISNKVMNKVWVRYNPLMMIRLDTTSNVGENITEFHRQPKKTTMSIFQ